MDLYVPRCYSMAESEIPPWKTEVFGVSWMTAIQKLVNSIQVGLETSHLQLLYFVMLKVIGLINWGTKNQNLHINWFSLETTKTRKKRIVEVPKASWYRPMPQRLQLVLCTSSCIQSLMEKIGHEELEEGRVFVAFLNDYIISNSLVFCLKLFEFQSQTSEPTSWNMKQQNFAPGIHHPGITDLKGAARHNGPL